MKKIAMILLSLCLLAAWILPATVFAAPAAQQPEETQTSQLQETPEIQLPTVSPNNAAVTYGAATLDGRKPLGGSSKMLDTAKAALLYELNTGTLLYSWNPDARMHPASLVKVVTVMVALEEASLDDSVTITSAMLSQLREGDLYTDFKEGEQITLGDLIHSTMLSSSNAASALIAIHISGSEGAFVNKMNARVKELGCKDTNFVNSHGIPADNQYTTARDTARIMETALQSDTFRQVFGTADYTIPANSISEARELKTTNYFISNRTVQKFYDNRVTGGKSGAASTEDRSIVFTAESGELNLLGVVMGAEGKTEADGHSLKHHGNFEEATVLLNYGFDNFATAQILFSGKSVAQFSVENGANDVVGRPVSTAFSALPAGTGLENLRWEYVLDKNLQAPVEKDQVIGAIQVWCGDICVAQSEMVSMNRAEIREGVSEDEAQTPQTDNSAFRQFLLTVGIVAGAAVGLGAVLMAVLWVRATVIRARIRKRRQSRRRSR